MLTVRFPNYGILRGTIVDALKSFKQCLKTKP